VDLFGILRRRDDDRDGTKVSVKQLFMGNWAASTI
jgi:hypothetical protein